MMDLEETANALHTFLLENFPDGMPSSQVAKFYTENREAGERVQKRKLKKLCGDFPHLLLWEGALVHAKIKANYASGLREAEIDKTALKFYNDCMKDNPFLRRKCEDRNRFDQEVAKWKDIERQHGRNHSRSPPTNIIFSLKKKWKLIEEKIVDENILVWKNDPASPKSPKTRQERAQEAVRRVRDARSELERNRHGIEVGDISFGLDDPNTQEVVSVGTQLVQDVAIYNKSSLGKVSVTIKSELAERKSVRVNGSKSFQLLEGEVHKVQIMYTSTTIGVMRSIIVFNIACETLNIDPFSVTRYFTVRTGDPEDQDILKPSSPYQMKKFGRGGFLNPEPVERPQGGGLTTFQNRLKYYGIPPYWRDAVTAKRTEDQFTELYFPSGDIPQDSETVGCAANLCVENYPHIFRRLLWTEEAQMEIDIRNYDIMHTTLDVRGRSLSLHVPGLAENRPSVLRGDKIAVQLSDNKEQSYEGYVERVDLENVILRFSNKFESGYVSGTRVDVRFYFKRMNIRTAHQALDTVIKSNSLICQTIFPDSLENTDHGQTRVLPPLNKEIARPEDMMLFNRDLNQEQRAAVYGVICSVARPSPYLIYGPPGTGKTVTLVESILQTLLSHGANSLTRVLVCAPSNTATDLLCERLAPYLRPQEMTRIIAYSRDKASVPSEVLRYAHYSDTEGAFVPPDSNAIKQKRVVAMTLSSGGKLPNIGIVGHFTHVFIDEAGHAIEPDALSCFADVTQKSASNPPVVVLAGDPQQLGPIIRSDVAKTFGLGVSLLERLTKRTVYQRQDQSSGNGGSTYDSRIITKLVRNYRSHPAILKLPNEHFYDGDLVSSADPVRSHCLKNWEHLPTKGFPLIFHGVQGEDRREGNSPSWFNAEEATIVKQYVELLVKDTKQNRCLPEEIGIVTPYHKQAQKIRMLLRSHGYDDCKVGSVDEFQGSERRVIIISTVRSTVEFMDFDTKHQLGFVANSKRFNVAITRAQALLIIVGNPYVLEHDIHWNGLIQYCSENGGYTGCEYSRQGKDDTDADVDDVIRDLATMKIGEEEKDTESSENDGFIMLSHTTAQEGPEWRVEE